MENKKKYLEPHKADVDDPVKERISTIVWYLIFIISIPFLIRHFQGLDSLRYYLPMVDLIANICSSTGARTHYVFKNLYDTNPTNISSFISTNFINLIALLGVSWNGMHYAFKTGKAWIGIKVSLIMYTMTYLIPTQGIGWAVDKFQSWFGDSFYKYPTDKDDMKGKDYNSHNRWVDYGGGLIFVILMLLIESLLIHLYLTIVDAHFD